MANSKLPKMSRQAQRKFRYPYHSDFHENLEEIRHGYGYHRGELESSYSADSQASDVEQQQLYPDSDSLDQCSSSTGPQERLLSDHTSIDVLILEREMKNILTDLEKLGTCLLEDDYKSLALTTEDEEEQKVDDSVKTWPPLAFPHSQDSPRKECGNENVTDRENDWEMLSTTDSVWTIETFAEEWDFRDSILETSPYAVSGSTAQFNGEPRIHTIPVEMMPPGVYTTQQHYPPKQVVNLEMLERADLWTTIRDSIRDFGAR